MNMPGITIRHASAMPAPTWSWLRMNDTTISIPDGLARNCQVAIEAGEELYDNHESFEGAVAGLQQRLDDAHEAAGSPADERAMVTAATRDDLGAADLDVPALSAYERDAVHSEIRRDIASDFETGVGSDARSYLNFLAGGTVVLASEPGTDNAANIRVTAGAGEASATSVDLIAAPDSTIDVALSLDCDASEASLIGSSLRVFAGARSHIDLTVYLTAGEGVTCIEDSGFVLDDKASVAVRHVVLSGAFTATGLAADLRGDESRIDIDTRYLAAGTERRDFNYIIRHRGRRTVSNMDANGVLAGTSQKTLRGTIDLVHGCKGAEGSEQETVLIASKGVDNKTIPTILCDEDDVAGNHGATIGHVRPEQLFYAACRGLSQDQTEALFMRAKFEDALIAAPDDQIRANVMRVATKLIPDFEEEIAC